MNRRALLSAVGGVGAAGLAGCVSADDDGADPPADTDTESPTEATETETDGETNTHGECNDAAATTEGPVELVDSSLAVSDTGCGQQADSAQVCFEEETGEVVVEGTIWGSDACDRPFLEHVDYDAGADKLVVTVVARHPETDETPACAQCITELGYRASVVFGGGLPRKVSVRHSHGPGSSDVITERER